MRKKYTGDNVAVIGITGGIGAGKSVVSRILRSNGLPVYDCDMRAKLIMDDAHSSVRDNLRSLLGDDIYMENGVLDRKKMAGIIFSDAEKRRGVNRIVHEAVRRDFCSWRDSLGLPVVFVESAILGTSDMASMCRSIWLVDAPQDVRINRVAERNRLSREAVMERMETQARELDLLPEEKIVRIDNDDNVPLIDQVKKLIGEIKNI